jgi:hypothetical protein
MFHTILDLSKDELKDYMENNKSIQFIFWCVTSSPRTCFKSLNPFNKSNLSEWQSNLFAFS